MVGLIISLICFGLIALLILGVFYYVLFHPEPKIEEEEYIFNVQSYKLRVHVGYDLDSVLYSESILPYISKVYFEDKIKVCSAYNDARAEACLTIDKGFQYDDRFYPAHRITLVEIVKDDIKEIKETYPKGLEVVYE